ncbi:hypothetical protein [Anaerobranca gottschalkii]|uniref:Uncharacterized protein n=1 Tax=Anaerobranca gottschalkii DSM 13577 TaxID=1120990 RepID=A0A1I0AKA5_9FIRM|nr:hypothetical protein [Anaerobranca gottschalkii]SES94787.1 hypothetical protein SAMN03080614_102319 [Anaerobranca gottschalkii DSM 13577]
MVWQGMIILIFSTLVYFEGKKLLVAKNYWDLVVVMFFYLLAFYYTWSFAADREVFNPLEGINNLLEPIGKWLFIEFLGIS